MAAFNVLRRLFALTLPLFVLQQGVADAGDAATVNILGFSPDGAIFAFEEYGVQDGSGFPYANRFYINTANDSFVSGTPIRVRIDHESNTVDDARAEAKANGQSVIADGILAANRGYTAGWNAVTEMSADTSRMSVGPRPVFPPFDAALEFRIADIGVTGPALCNDIGDVKGYRLTRLGTIDGAQTRVIHEDSSVPQSRGCPLGYGIGGIQTFYPESGDPVFAVIIFMRQFGFEGPDHRWLAVVGRL